MTERGERLYDRLRQTREWMLQRSLDCLAVYSYRSALTAYWTGYCPRHSVTNASLLLIVQDDALHITRLPIHRATAEMADVQLRHVCGAKAAWSVATVDDLVRTAGRWLAGRVGVRHVGLAAYGPEAGIADRLRIQVGGELEDVTEELYEFLAPKDDYDQAALRTAAGVAQEAFETGIGALRVGGGVGAARRAAEVVLRDHGSRTWHCFAGVGHASGHSFLQPNTSVLAPGQTVFFEVIPDVELFCPEVVASAFVGEVPAGASEIDAAIRSSLDGVIATTQAQTTFSDLFHRMMADLGAVGVPADHVYRLGHATGIDNIELPEFIDPEDGRALGAGRAISIHPNATVPGHGTFLRGGTLLVSTTGCEPLFTFPPGPIVVG